MADTIQQIKVKDKVYDLAAKYDAYGNDIGNTYTLSEVFEWQNSLRSIQATCTSIIAPKFNNDNEDVLLSPGTIVFTITSDDDSYWRLSDDLDYQYYNIELYLNNFDSEKIRDSFPTLDKLAQYNLRFEVVNLNNTSEPWVIPVTTQAILAQGFTLNITLKDEMSAAWLLDPRFTNWENGSFGGFNTIPAWLNDDGERLIIIIDSKISGYTEITEYTADNIIAGCIFLQASTVVPGGTDITFGNALPNIEVWNVVPDTDYFNCCLSYSYNTENNELTYGSLTIDGDYTKDNLTTHAAIDQYYSNGDWYSVRFSDGYYDWGFYLYFDYSSDVFTHGCSYSLWTPEYDYDASQSIGYTYYPFTLTGPHNIDIDGELEVDIDTANNTIKNADINLRYNGQVYKLVGDTKETIVLSMTTDSCKGGWNRDKTLVDSGIIRNSGIIENCAGFENITTEEKKALMNKIANNQVEILLVPYSDTTITRGAVVHMSGWRSAEWCMMGFFLDFVTMSPNSERGITTIETFTIIL